MSGKLKPSLDCKNPFQDLKIASWDPLRRVQRSPCPLCGRSRKYYCYDCYVLVGVTRELIPTVALPVKIDIVKHKEEASGKSTSAHAKILSPDWVTIYQYPDMPKYDKTKTVLIYPKEGSLTVEELVASVKGSSSSSARSTPLKELERVVFIDSTWSQSRGMCIHDNLSDLVCVQLKDAVTCFWRTQWESKHYLATIEAVYYFVKEYHDHSSTQAYDGEYDNLLYYFAYQYNVVQGAISQREENMQRKRPAVEDTTEDKPSQARKHPKTAQ
ncbi:tRNA-uridine aminocarboxypropyltransferase 1-like [Dysidea avara]|uniref:tRNA-uridine aminocarboxypropyltransferase 1-like n=1 Tax=Dysidea avara TaxID=196820 RepID=UPI00331B7C7D